MGKLEFLRQHAAQFLARGAELEACDANVEPGLIRLYRQLAQQSWEAYHDPFFNESDLREQEHLFAQKAAALHGSESRYQQSMRELYITIAEHCRESLQQLHLRH
jgi:hypothetical protein